MGQGARGTFADFAAARWPVLFRCAYLLTGNSSDAEDCVQAALAKAYARWARIEQLEQPEAYVRKMVVNTFLSGRRRRGALPGQPDGHEASYESDVAARLDVERAVAQLPPRQRAAVVLRFYCDCTEQQAADALGCSVGTVKSQTYDALRNLRRSLGSTADTIEGTA